MFSYERQLEGAMYLNLWYNSPGHKKKNGHWRLYQMREKKTHRKRVCFFRGGRGSQKGCQNYEEWERRVSKLL